MNRVIFSCIAALGVVLSTPVLALDLHGARAQGAVGEKLDGYAAVIKPSPEVNTLVAEVNAKRKQKYAEISKQNGQPADVVAKLAAPEIINGLGTGELYQDSDGSWKKR